MSIVQSTPSAMLHGLIHLVRKNPDVRTCIRRLLNACMSRDITCEERGKVLKPDLLKQIQKHYTVFLHTALEMSYMCGFCAFHIRQENNIPLPFVLPLGSFTWCTEAPDKYSKKRKYEDSSPICRYRVKMMHGNLREEDIIIINFDVPMFVDSKPTTDNLFALQTPMAHLLEKFDIVRRSLRVIDECTKWNVNKHVVVTEQLDLKDQTTSGIQLLDDFRRYSLSGQHNILRDHGVLRLRNRDNKPLNTVNDAAYSWMQDQFGMESSEKEAKVHILPPNMQIQELNNIDYGRDFDTFNEDFINNVYAFFDLPRNKDISGANTTSSGEMMSRQQYMNILGLCRYLEHVAQHAYAAAFRCEIQDVTFTLTPQNRLDVNSAADIKTLCDANVWPENSRNHLRKSFSSFAE